jgi:hypothetical protein
LAPTGPAILGRALLGHFGVPVLSETEDGNWGSGFVRPVPRAEAVERFAAREVLLVDPRVARVLDAARDWRAARGDRDMGGGAYLDLCETLATAVDALGQPTLQRNLNPGSDGPSKPPSDLNPAEPVTANLVTTSRGLAVPTPTTGGPDHDGLTGRPIPPTSQRYMCKRCGRSGGELTENGCPVHGSASVGMHTDEGGTTTPAPPDAGTDAPTPAGEASAQVTPASGGDTGADTEPGPEPAGEPGWDRGAVVAGIEEIEQSHPCSARHLRALLADRDQLATSRDVWRNHTLAADDELADLRRERDYLRTWSGLMSVLDQHYPPDVQLGPDSDPGPRILALTRALDAARDRWQREAVQQQGLTVAAEQERDAARDELAERTRERDHSDAALEAAARDMAQMTADRDRLTRELADTVQENHRWAATHAGLEAKLAEVIAERNRYRASLPAEVQDYWHWRAECERLRREHDAALATARRAGAAELAGVREELARMAGDVTDLRATLAMRDSQLRDVRAELEYVRADREGVAGQVRRLLAERATARRDVAADTLEEAANDASVLLESGARAFTARGLRARADIIRADGRPVPGSPELAGGGDDG